MVYFATSGRFFKIGWSLDPVRRVAGLRTGAPEGVELVAVAEGDRRDEGALHDLWAPWRVSGEWFVRDADFDWLLERGELLALVAAHAAESLDEIVWWGADAAVRTGGLASTPPTGPRRPFMLRWAPGMLERADIQAGREGMSRNGWLELLVAREVGL